MTSLPPWAEALLAMVAFALGTLRVGPWLMRRIRAGTDAELIDRLKQTFATRHDMNNFRQSLEALVEECSQTARLAQDASKLALQNADTGLDQTRELKIRVEAHNERLVAEVLEPIKEIVREQREMGRTLAAQTALLERLTRQVDGQVGGRG